MAQAKASKTPLTSKKDTIEKATANKLNHDPKKAAKRVHFD